MTFGKTSTRTPQLTIFAWVLVTCTFFPYFGLSVGKNTSISASTLVSLLGLGFVWANPQLRLVLGLLVSSLIVLLGASGLTNGEMGSVPASLVFFLDLLPAFLIAALTWRLPTVFIAPLRFWVIVTALYAVVQKYFFLDRSSLPFSNYYNLAGIASAEQNLDIIVKFIRRPFAFFPEPSYLATTIALTMAALLVSLATARRKHWIDIPVIGFGAFAIFLSGSGATILELPLLTVLAAVVLLKGRKWVLAVILLVPFLIIGSNAILGQRESTFNWSWAQRTSSIAGGFRYWVDHPLSIPFGVGSGKMNELFTSGQISLAGLPHFFDIPDVYSVLGRVLLEYGILAGGCFLVAMAYWIFKAVQAHFGFPVALVGIAIWIVAGGITTSYSSAVWIWGFPFLCLGLLLNDKSLTIESPALNQSRRKMA